LKHDWLTVGRVKMLLLLMLLRMMAWEWRLGARIVGKVGGRGAGRGTAEFVGRRCQLKAKTGNSIQCQISIIFYRNSNSMVNYR
jgi:hypothetical protein